MSQTTEYPDYVARFYDVVYAKIRAGVDTEYFMRKISEANGPVLELGVGTGRFFSEAIKAGAEVYGIDVNQSMIDQLKKKLEPAHHDRVFVQDARQLKLDRKFDLIVAPFRVFSHFITVADQLAVLNRCCDHLNENGRFIFDVFVPNLKMLVAGMDEHVDFEGEYEPGKKLKRIVSAKADYITQTNHVTMKFVWDEDGERITKTWRFPMRYFFRYELEHLIARSHLRLEQMYGDYYENKLNSESTDFVVVCGK